MYCAITCGGAYRAASMQCVLAGLCCLVVRVHHLLASVTAGGPGLLSSGVHVAMGHPCDVSLWVCITSSFMCGVCSQVLLRGAWMVWVKGGDLEEGGGLYMGLCSCSGFSGACAKLHTCVVNVLSRQWVVHVHM